VSSDHGSARDELRCCLSSRGWEGVECRAELLAMALLIYLHRATYEHGSFFFVLNFREANVS